MFESRSAAQTADGTSVLSTIGAADENQWNNLVVQSDLGSLFHRTEWLAAVEEGLDAEPAHAVVRTDENPVAILPNFVSELSLPHDGADRLASAVGVSRVDSGTPGYGGPVIATDEVTNLERLLDGVGAATGRSVLYHQITTYDLGHVRYGATLQSLGYEPTSTFALFLIDLCPGWTAVHGGMDKERRKALRRANEQPARVTVEPLGTDLPRTHEMYARNVERVGGETLPERLFESLATHLSDRVRVFTAHVDGETVGRYVHLLDEETSTLHHWLSAIPDRSCYDSYPSELLHERAIRWGIDNGYERYNFEKARAHVDDGVFRFKSKYGGRVVPLLRWQRGESRVAWPLFKIVRSHVQSRAL